MSQIKIKTIAEKTDSELENFISEQQSKLAQLKIDMQTKQVKSVKDISHIKTALARALTIKRQREIAKEEAEND